MVLEHHAAIRPRTGDLAIRAEHDAVGRHQQSRDQIEQGGFAAARVPDQGDELARIDLEGDILERDERALPGLERHLHIFNLHIVFFMLVSDQ